MKTMKRIVPVLLLAAMLATSGCATSAVSARMKEPVIAKDKEGEYRVKRNSQPEFAALLPFTLVWDIVTAPVQLVVLAYGLNWH